MNHNELRSLPIGFIDSGLGGISVLREALKVMPNENYIYYGDSANAPYGTKPQEEIKTLTFKVAEYLLSRGIKGLAVACNTATSAAVRDLRTTYPDLPIVGIEPALKPAVEINRGGQILVMATPMTIAQEKFQTLLKRYEDQALIEAVSCKGLMEFVEQGILEGDILEQYFNEKLLPYLSKPTDSIVLGCTHYPFLKPFLTDYLAGKNIDIIDGSLGTAKELKRRLNMKNLLLEEGDSTENNGESFDYSRIEIINSSMDQNKIDLSWKLLKLS